MNKIYLAAWVALLVVGLASSASYAGGAGARSGLMTFNSYDLIGSPVQNPQGRFLGVVKGTMIASDGEAFAIVNHGDADVYGPGGISTPVPVAALKISETESGQEMIVLNTDREHLDLAPYLDAAVGNDRQYIADIDTFFGVQPAWTAKGSCLQ